MDAPLPDSLRWSRRFAGFAWLGWLFAMILLWLHVQCQILHPWSEVFFAIALIGGIFSFFGLFYGFYRIVRGPRRRKAFEWGFLATLPLMFWGMFAGYMFICNAKNLVPYNTIHLMGRVMANAIMELEARYLYPHRMETDRLVMFYDDRITNPQEDIDSLEAYLKSLEELTGRKLDTKLYLVRGKALGLGRLCINGIAMSSSESPSGRLDRHELAHAFMYWATGIKVDPPFLFVEGWAMAMEAGGKNLKQLYVDSREFRQWLTWELQSKNDPDDSMLKVLVSKDWYHKDEGPVYSIGGMFVDYLVRQYGAQKFLQLYQKTGSQTFLQDFQDIYGKRLEEMEKPFWGEVQKRVAE